MLIKESVKINYYFIYHSLSVIVNYINSKKFIYLLAMGREGAYVHHIFALYPIYIDKNINKFVITIYTLLKKCNCFYMKANH